MAAQKKEKLKGIRYGCREGEERGRRNQPGAEMIKTTSNKKQYKSILLMELN